MVGIPEYDGGEVAGEDESIQDVPWVAKIRTFVEDEACVDHLNERISSLLYRVGGLQKLEPIQSLNH